MNEKKKLSSVELLELVLEKCHRIPFYYDMTSENQDRIFRAMMEIAEGT